MSQIEQNIRQFLSKNPEIEKCIQCGLINRRSLARYLIKHNVVNKDKFDAIIAALRRFDFKEYKKEELALFKKTKIRVKDNIIILDFEKEKSLIQELKKIIEVINYDKEETLKIVIGSSTVKIFIDESNKNILKNLIEKYKLLHEYKNISEISMTFSKEAINTKGLISFITKELYVNDILISELLTASPELLIYLKEEYAVKTYELIKRLQK